MNAISRCPIRDRLSVLCAVALLVVGAGVPGTAPRAAVKNAEDLLIVSAGPTVAQEALPAPSDNRSEPSFGVPEH